MMRGRPTKEMQEQRRRGAMAYLAEGRTVEGFAGEFDISKACAKRYWNAAIVAAEAASAAVKYVNYV